MKSHAALPRPTAAPAVPTPQPTPAVDAAWSCTIGALGPGSVAPEKLTVGAEFLLSCQGPAVALDQAHLALELPKDAQYALRLLAVRGLKDGTAEFVATSWTAGEVKLKPVLTDGAKHIALGDVQFTVASVIDPQKNPENKAYAPWAPVALVWPFWIWIALALFAVLLLAPIVARNSRTACEIARASRFLSLSRPSTMEAKRLPGMPRWAARAARSNSAVILAMNICPSIGRSRRW